MKSKSPRKSAVILPMMNQWVADALAHAPSLSQGALSRKVCERLKYTEDRSIINKIIKGRRGVSADEVFAIADITGFAAPNLTSLVDVPLVSWVSAGELKEVSASDSNLNLRVAGLPPGDWIAMRVEGNSMDRISPPDSIIFVNRQDRRLVPNACYVIDDGAGLTTYKRYRPGPPQRFEPVSTDKDLEPLYPDNDPTIIGRVKRTVLDL